jgi:uncharacterized protein YkwD
MIRPKLILPAVLLLAVVAAPVRAEIQFAIGEPIADSTRSGIGQISGWAVGDNEIIAVEALIDGVSVGLVPYGGTRQDVAAAFPNIPDSEHSGWSMKWNYSLLAEGEHLLTVVVTDIEGDQQSSDITFNTTGFKSEFIVDPESVRTTGATITTPEHGRIVITGAEVEGESVDIELHWDTASQQFLIDKIHREAAELENLKPVANAGPNVTAETGQAVSITGSASDPDGSIQSWRWNQVSGPAVALNNASGRTVSFTAPDIAGSIRLRLTVTDSQGAVDSDDIIITAEEPAPEPNQAPTANAGANLTVSGAETVTITGSASDPDGTIESWSWTQVSGPAVSLNNAGSPAVAFTAPDSTSDIRLRLTVADDDGATDTDDVTITVEVDAGPDNTTGELLSDMLPLINEARGQARFCGETEYPAQGPLSWSDSLADIARQHSMDMARQGYFSHTSLDGTTMGSRIFPYWDGSRVGENIAAASSDRALAYVVNLWLDSPGHCALIMSPDFTHAGIGSGHDFDNGYKYQHFWTLDFGG